MSGRFHGRGAEFDNTDDFKNGVEDVYGVSCSDNGNRCESMLLSMRMLLVVMSISNVRRPLSLFNKR